MLVKEEAGWVDSEIYSEMQGDPRCPAGCKMQFNQSAIFFFLVQMILIIGMHNFFNMQIKSFKTWKKK